MAVQVHGNNIENSLEDNIAEINGLVFSLSATKTKYLTAGILDATNKIGAIL